MDNKKRNSLKEKIINEMTVNHSDALEKNFNLAKQFVRVTKEGKIDVLVKDKVTGLEAILLYLIGKLYAKEAELTPTYDVGNKELMNELGIPYGSLGRWLKDLRDANKITQVSKGKYTHHIIALNVVEKTLKSIERKISKLA